VTVERLWILRTGSGTGPQYDENGDRVEAGAGEALRLPLDAYNVEPRSSGDVVELGRQGYTEGFIVYAPADAPNLPKPADRVECRGVVYDLEGVVGEWRNGWAPGLFDGAAFAITRGVG
jgi:hypothetical protein